MNCLSFWRFNTASAVEIFLKVLRNESSFFFWRELYITFDVGALLLKEIREEHKELLSTQIHRFVVHEFFFWLAEAIQVNLFRVSPFISPAQVPIFLFMSLVLYWFRFAEIFENLIDPDLLNVFHNVL